MMEADEEKSASIERAQALYDKMGNAWFSRFIWENNYSIQCGEYLLELHAGGDGEPPWVYAYGDIFLHYRLLSEKDATVLPEGCDDMFLDLISPKSTRLMILKDRFVDQDDYEYALLQDGKRVRDIPAAMVEFAGSRVPEADGAGTKVVVVLVETTVDEAIGEWYGETYWDEDEHNAHVHGVYDAASFDEDRFKEEVVRIGEDLRRALLDRNGCGDQVTVDAAAPPEYTKDNGGYASLVVECVDYRWRYTAQVTAVVKAIENR